jgi:hypothetical protein
MATIALNSMTKKQQRAWQWQEDR